MKRRWMLLLGCGIALGSFGMVRTWGEPPTRGGIPYRFLPVGDGKLLSIVADQVVQEPGNSPAIRARGSVVVTIGNVRLHVPQAAVRFVPEDDHEYRDIFVEPAAAPAGKP